MWSSCELCVNCDALNVLLLDAVWQVNKTKNLQIE
jgi:hypothetical protein